MEIEKYTKLLLQLCKYLLIAFCSYLVIKLLLFAAVVGRSYGKAKNCPDPAPRSEGSPEGPP